MPIAEKYCVVCSKALIGRQRKYCGAQCTSKAYYYASKHPCLDCGKLVCRESDRCYSCAKIGERNSQWRGGPISCVCEVCGKEFEVRRSIVTKGHGRFCSYGCVGQWYAENWVGKKNHNWLAARENIICQYCGKAFRISPSQRHWKHCSLECKRAASRVGRVCGHCAQEFTVTLARQRDGRGQYCSQTCYWEVQSETLRGDKNPNWRGGKSFESYDMAFDATLKARVRERDGHICALCSALAKDVHHIDYDKRNNLLENFITLCRPCHCRTNSRRDYWQSYFTGASHGAIMAAIPRYVPQGA